MLRRGERQLCGLFAQSGFGQFHDLGEVVLLVDGQVGENLAVQVDAGGLETVQRNGCRKDRSGGRQRWMRRIHRVRPRLRSLRPT